MKEKIQNIWKEHREVVQGILVALGIVVLLGALFFVSENIGDRSNDKTMNDAPAEEEVNPLLEDGQVLDDTKMKSVEEITMAEFKKLLKKKTTTVVMLGYDDCYWCQQQKPILESVLYEKDLSVKYLNVNKITEEEYQYLQALHEDLASFGTPTFISIKSKKVRKVSEEAKTRTKLLEMFEDMGVTK